MIKKHLSVILIIFMSCVPMACEKGSAEDTAGRDTIFDFESDNQGWFSENENMTIAHNTDSEYVLHGSGSLKGTCSTDGRIVLRNYLPEDIDLTGLTLVFNVFIPESLANLGTKYECGVWLGVYTDQWAWMDAPVIDTAGWNRYTFTPDGIGENAVYTIAFEINNGEGTGYTWSGELYFDYISWQKNM